MILLSNSKSKIILSNSFCVKGNLSLSISLVIPLIYVVSTQSSNSNGKKRLYIFLSSGLYKDIDKRSSLKDDKPLVSTSKTTYFFHLFYSYTSFQ